MTSSIPETMTAIAITEPGGPEVLVATDLPVPTPGEREILVHVEAAGVNRPDVLQRQGGYPPPPGAPATPGLEVAGWVAMVGPGAKRYHPGDWICALVPGGGYAEYCVVHEDNALPVPQGLSAVEAAGIPETFFTVWTNVFERGRLKAGEVFLCHGGSSGIGTTAIQLGPRQGGAGVRHRRLGRKVPGLRGTRRRAGDQLPRRGFRRNCQTATNGQGADVILDMIGGSYIPRNIAVAARDGRIVNIAFLEGAKAEVDFLPVMLKRLTLTGSTLRIRSVAEKAEIARALEEWIWPLIERGTIKPEIYRTFPMREAAAAHELMESSAHIGKIVLTT